jgi:hypothetical protein
VRSEGVAPWVANTTATGAESVHERDGCILLGSTTDLGTEMKILGMLCYKTQGSRPLHSSSVRPTTLFSTSSIFDSVGDRTLQECEYEYD